MGDEWTLDDFHHLHLVQLLKENMAANLHLQLTIIGVVWVGSEHSTDSKYCGGDHLDF